MQAEISALQKENDELKAELCRKKKIIRHKGIYTVFMSQLTKNREWKEKRLRKSS